jgi:hypothetical protein
MTVDRALSRGVRLALGLAVVVVFVGIVAWRGGPALDDAYGVVRPTTALSHGDLVATARAETLPQPPGYPLLAAPLVAALRPVLGSPTWCDDQVPTALRGFVPACRSHATPWYRSQALLGILAWIALVAGCVRLLRVAGAGGGWAEVFLVAVLAVMPAASDGIVETFHPQDLVCVGLIAAAVAEALRRRWVATGVLFGAAFACKQFAILPLLAVVTAAPGWRERGRVLASAAAVVACVVLPFYVADPAATIRTLDAVDAAGITSLSGGTLLGKSALSVSDKLLVARDGPILLAAALCLWARWRARHLLLAPVALIGLVAACLAARLVGEVWFASYYLLAVSAMLVILDLAARRLPWRSLAWIAVTGVLVESAGGNPTSDVGAVLSLMAAIVAVIFGLSVLPADLSGQRRASPATSIPR